MKGFDPLLQSVRGSVWMLEESEHTAPAETAGRRARDQYV